MTGRRLGWILGALGLGATRLLAAQEPPFQVNASIGGDHQHVGVAASSDGSFVVVWEETLPGAAAARIVARRFDAAGGPLDEKEIVVAVAGPPARPAVAALEGGDFVVVWGDPLGVRARRCGGAGVPQPDVVTISPAPSAGFDVAADPAGGFAVVWESPAGTGLAAGTGSTPPAARLQAQRFAASGEPEGGPLAIDDALEDRRSADPSPPRIAIAADRSLIVTWRNGGAAGDVYVRAFDPNGTELTLPGLPTATSQVNLFQSGLQRRATVAVRSRDQLAVAWESGPSQVALDLALCLDGSKSTDTAGEGFEQHADPTDLANGEEVDALKLELQGTAAALRDPRLIPADGTVSLSVLEYGGQGVETLVDGVPIKSAADAANLAASILSHNPKRPETGTSAARCICAAAKQLTGTDPCPADDALLCPPPPELPVEPPPPVDGRRKVIALATEALPGFYVDASSGRPPVVVNQNGPWLACELQGAASRARRAGVQTLDAFRIPVGGFIWDKLEPYELRPAAVPRVDLGAAVFPAAAEDDCGFVVGVEDAQGFAEALGRTLEGELAADGGVFARLFATGKPAPPEIQVNSTVAGDQSAPDVAVDEQGDWLFAWQDRGRQRISAQLFSPQGEPMGGEQDLSLAGAFPQRPRLAPLDGRQFVAVWEQRQAAAGPRDLWARIVETSPAVACAGPPYALCLFGNELQMTLEWRSKDGKAGRARASTLPPNAGFFSIDPVGGAPAEVQLAVRVVPGVPGAIVEMVGLSDLGLTLTVTDTRTGRTVLYKTRPGELFPSFRDDSSFSALGLAAGGLSKSLRYGSERGGPTVFYADRAAATRAAATACVAGPETLCLAVGRFQVEVERRTPGGAQKGKPFALGDLAGGFSFGSGDALDALVKVRDGCRENQHVWLYAAGLSADAVEITVTDTVTGRVRKLRDPAGGNLLPSLDRRAFPCPSGRPGDR
jgi:hypothetical protein